MNITMVARLAEKLGGPWRIGHVDEETGACDIEDEKGQRVATVYLRFAQGPIASLPSIMGKLLMLMDAVDGHVARWEKARPLIYRAFCRDPASREMSIDPFYKPYNALGLVEAMRAYPPAPPAPKDEECPRNS